MGGTFMLSKNTIGPLLLAVLSSTGCDSDSDTGGAVQATDVEEPLTWENYSIEPPTGEVLALLTESPLLYPTKECTDVNDLDVTIPSEAVEISEDGIEQFCVWENTTGTVPEGLQYTQVAECDKVFTQAPSWFVQPTQLFETDPSIMDDEAYKTESDWVRDQIRSSGCACCHSSASESGNTSGFDIDAPFAWTDTIKNHQLAQMTGLYEEHRNFGYLDPAENHGFSREDTMFPTTDPERMRAFFVSELERRNAPQEDYDEGERILQSFFSRLLEEPTECFSPWTGIEDGKIIWDGDGSVRQIYVLKDDAQTPGFPPLLDLPEGTVWALYVNPDGEPIASGDIGIGEIPEGTQQFIPADGTPPQLEEGATYRLFATPDFQLIRELNCSLVHESTSTK